MEVGAREILRSGSAVNLARRRRSLADHLNGLHTLLITDTNGQAADLSAQLRARLVEYGEVDDERTAWLASTGNRAGRGRDMSELWRAAA